MKVQIGFGIRAISMAVTDRFCFYFSECLWHIKTFTCIKLKHLQPFIFCDAPNLLRTRLPSKVVFKKKTNIYMYKLSSQKTSLFKQHALVKLKWPYLNNGSSGHRFILMPVSSFWLEVLKHWHFQGCKTVDVNAFSSWKITFETWRSCTFLLSYWKLKVNNLVSSAGSCCLAWASVKGWMSIAGGY